MQTPHHSQRGIGIVEMLAGVAIIAGIVYFLVPQVQKLFSGVSSYGLQTQLQSLKKCVLDTSPRPNYAGVSAANLVRAGCVPDNMINGTAITNAYGGAVTVAAVSIGGLTDNAFSIAFASVPRQDCAASVTNLLASSREITVGSTTVKNDATPRPSQTVIATACDNERNDVSFVSTT